MHIFVRDIQLTSIGAKYRFQVPPVHLRNEGLAQLYTYKGITVHINKRNPVGKQRCNFAMASNRQQSEQVIGAVKVKKMKF